MKPATEEMAARLVREHIASHRSAPRTSSWVRLARLLYRTPDNAFTAAFGCVVVGVTCSFFWIDNPPAFFRLIQVAALLLGLVCIVAPAARAFRVSRAIRDGLVVVATAIDTQDAGDQVSGRLRVEHPTGPFDSEFRELRSVVGRLTIGARLEALVDPHRPKMLFVIGGVRSRETGFTS